MTGPLFFSNEHQHLKKHRAHSLFQVKYTGFKEGKPIAELSANEIRFSIACKIFKTGRGPPENINGFTTCCLSSDRFDIIRIFIASPVHKKINIPPERMAANKSFIGRSIVLILRMNHFFVAFTTSSKSTDRPPLSLLTSAACIKAKISRVSLMEKGGIPVSKNSAILTSNGLYP